MVNDLLKARRTLPKTWLCPLVVCEQDKVASWCLGLVFHSEVAMKGLGGEKKRIEHNILDLFPDIPTIQKNETFTVNRRKHAHTHTHTHTHTHICA